MGKHKASTSRGGRGKGARGSRGRPRSTSLRSQTRATRATTESQASQQPTGPGVIEPSLGDGPEIAQQATTSHSLQPPTSHQSSGARRIWLFGDSFIRRAKERAVTTGNHNLGLEGYEVCWWGRGGTTLRNYPSDLQERLRYSPIPTSIIIHVGSNDLGRYSAKECRQAVDNALNSTRALLPWCHICFSSILPRLYYYAQGRNITSQAAIDNVRKSVNKYAKRRIRRMHNASFINHMFNCHEHWYFNRDGIHLSDEGSDILINDFKRACQFALTGQD
ncbi:uncharacterized protein LOC121415177 isoform X2 [Lytechinus variegatus]|uniref:uncharacterized protein LOC121415177 isoform X2 n=1 Tax=Lytechinus variegatus TaxID=7654 RepID=UPI001BB23A08|nr:uncharacterized protein LOC121415177 isoform X2 [Lytechinus variegatus]